MITLTGTVGDVAGFLRGMGEGGLADRLDYLGSDADLDVGEFPAAAESARGFLALFARVGADSEVGLGCSPEGWVVGEWRWFADDRGASVWFLDVDRVMFSATKKDGEFVVIEGQGYVTSLAKLTQTLVDEGLFYWRLN